MSKYKILTDSGWQDFQGVRKLPPQPTVEIILEDTKIICTKDHLIYSDLFNCQEAQKYRKGDYILTKDGLKQIIDIKEGKEQEVYDIIGVENGNRFYANDVLVHNCEFIGKTDSLIDSSILRQKMVEVDNSKLTYKFVVDGDIRFYKDVDPYKKLLISIDTSMGVDGDFAAIQVFQTSPCLEQVAEWKSDKLNQNEQVEKIRILTEWLFTNIKQKGNKHPEIYWSLENNGSAEGFICALRQMEQEKGDTYIKRATLINEIGNKRIGFTTTNRTKPMACSQLKILFESNRFKISSREYLIELSNFSAKSAQSYSARGETHDDLISASLTIILMYLQCKNQYSLDMDIMPIMKLDDTENNTDYQNPIVVFTHI